MSIFSYHLLKANMFAAAKVLCKPPGPGKVPGLIHAECMTAMTLGSQIFSPSRMLVSQLVVFAQWADEVHLDNFLRDHGLGKTLAKGWHTRLFFLRQWGIIDKFQLANEAPVIPAFDGAIVAVTLARMKLLQVPRFIKWGRPVEKLVRDHPGKTLALASFRLPRTVSTFSVWKNQQEMLDMVQGHSNVPEPMRHSAAMLERNRKDFHIQFTTLRFCPISEFGEWQGRKNIIPGLKEIRPKWI